MQTFVAVTVLMMAANGMPEEAYTESITESATSKLEVPLRARVSLPEKKVVLTETEETVELKRENEALKLVVSANEKLMADKDARNADMIARIAALKEQMKRQGPLLLPLSSSRKLLLDQGVSSAETSQLSCENASYGFRHAESDDFTTGAWSRSIASR